MNKYRFYRHLAAILTLSIILSSCGIEDIYGDGMGSLEETEEQITDNDEEEPEAVTEAAVYVHVAGCVRHPGVYMLPEGSRVSAAVEAAGGFTEEAACDQLNLAAVAEDGKQYRIPSREEAESTDAQDTVFSDGKLDINRAGADELMELNGIGESRAKAIISYREEQGGFKEIEDIKKVSGIGDGLFNNIKDNIIVR